MCLIGVATVILIPYLKQVSEQVWVLLQVKADGLVVHLHAGHLDSNVLELHVLPGNAAVVHHHHRCVVVLVVLHVPVGQNSRGKTNSRSSWVVSDELQDTMFASTQGHLPAKHVLQCQRLQRYLLQTTSDARQNRIQCRYLATAESAS